MWILDKFSQLFERFIALTPAEWNRITVFAYVEIIYMYFDLKSDSSLREGLKGPDKSWSKDEWVVYSFMKISPHILLADAILGLGVPSVVYLFLGGIMIFILLGKHALQAIIDKKLDIKKSKDEN